MGFLGRLPVVVVMRRSIPILPQPSRWRLHGSSRYLFHSIALFAGFAVAMAAVAGCSRRRGEMPPLGQVSGVVSLDGQPLPRASVAFVPYARGSASYGFTNDAGRYTLEYGLKLPGAVVGRHRVEIRTGGEGRDKDGNFVETAEQLPAKYHLKSELTATVVPESNEIDFQLGSRPAANTR
jgi:hypothetical protein